MLDSFALAAIAGTFLLAGLVKGALGFGLPTIALALLTVALGLPQAMVLMLVPAFVANLWQALAGGRPLVLLARIWPFLLTAGATVWIGALALTRVELHLLSALLGLVLVVYAVVSLGGLRLTLTARQEAWAGPLIGTVNGVLGGMTGSYVVPGIMFLQALGLPRDLLIQALGMLFLLSTLVLGAALGSNGFLSLQLGLTSTAALVPTLLGMAAGQALRRRLPEARFRQAFFAGLLLLGSYIVATAFAGGGG